MIKIKNVFPQKRTANFVTSRFETIRKGYFVSMSHFERKKGAYLRLNSYNIILDEGGEAFEFLCRSLMDKLQICKDSRIPSKTFGIVGAAQKRSKSHLGHCMVSEYS